MLTAESVTKTSKKILPFMFYKEKLLILMLECSKYSKVCSVIEYEYYGGLDMKIHFEIFYYYKESFQDRCNHNVLKIQTK